MIVYKAIALLAIRAAEAAIALARHESVTPNAKVANGFKDVPSVLLEPVAVDAANLAKTVIKDGFLKLEDVYRDVPRDRWPQADATSAGAQP